jgi:hypothetical protein
MLDLLSTWRRQSLSRRSLESSNAMMKEVPLIQINEALLGGNVFCDKVCQGFSQKHLDAFSAAAN